MKQPNNILSTKTMITDFRLLIKQINAFITKSHRNQGSYKSNTILINVNNNLINKYTSQRDYTVITPESRFIIGVPLRI